MGELVLTVWLLTQASAPVTPHVAPADPVFTGLLVGALTASSADVVTSWMAIGNPGLVERNPLIVPFSHSRGVYGVFGVASVVAQGYGLYRLHQTHPNIAKGLAFTLMIVEGTIATRNAHLLARHPY